MPDPLPPSSPACTTTSNGYYFTSELTRGESAAVLDRVVGAGAGASNGNGLDAGLGTAATTTTTTTASATAAAATTATSESTASRGTTNNHNNNAIAFSKEALKRHLAGHRLSEEQQQLAAWFRGEKNLDVDGLTDMLVSMMHFIVVQFVGLYTEATGYCLLSQCSFQDSLRVFALRDALTHTAPFLVALEHCRQRVFECNTAATTTTTTTTTTKEPSTTHHASGKRRDAKPSYTVPTALTRFMPSSPHWDPQAYRLAAEKMAQACRRDQAQRRQQLLALTQEVRARRAPRTPPIPINLGKSSDCIQAAVLSFACSTAPLSANTLDLLSVDCQLQCSLTKHAIHPRDVLVHVMHFRQHDMVFLGHAGTCDAYQKSRKRSRSATAVDASPTPSTIVTTASTVATAVVVQEEVWSIDTENDGLCYSVRK
jgi:hypothetical protein